MKTVIVTGANGNLGTIVTSTFLAKGYKVIATVRNEEARSELPHHNNLQVHALNLDSEEEAATFIESCLEQYKTIDGALLLAGGFASGTTANTKSGDIRQQISLNFETAYHISRPLLIHMKEQGIGRLVFIGSRPALEPASGKNMVAYGLSKSLLFTLAGFINEEAKGTNVTATVVVPSTLDTVPNRKSMPNANPENWVKPEALAEILEFIVSDTAAPVREMVMKVYNNA